jgi:amino acid permease
MFNFSSSLSNKISSDHLNIKYKFKENRLDKLELSYKSSYFSIYISIACLFVCLILTALPNTEVLVYKAILFFLIFLLLQMFISFYYVLSDMKNFVNYDIKQEREIIKQKRVEEMNKDDI